MDFIERWDRFIEGQLQRVVRKSLGPAEGTDFLEAYTGALEEIAAHAEPVGHKRVFPFKRVILQFPMADERVAALTRVLSQRKQLVAEVTRKLEEAGCERPSPLRVEAVAVRAGAGARPYEIAFAVDLPPQPTLTLEIVNGETDRPTYTFGEPITNIGRLEEVFGDRKRLIRRNHLVFTDLADGINATVSRMHAHIAFDQEVGWYRLYDDRSKFGTRIRRGDALVDVPPGPQGGAWLRPEDEIHLGRARLIARFAEE